MIGERGGTGKEPAPEEAAVLGVVVDKEATVEKDTTPKVVVGEEPTVGKATPKVTLAPAPDDASREAEVAEATFGDGAD